LVRSSSSPVRHQDT